ncbi:hypothetical protein HBH68_098800 [Parastagonospora nodorum]|nr:hypothetical protein HBH68_098800 [Parastagonospora nodorum]KAH5495675.1 hypothetical protein HBI31_103230 [Parastagonospora nodorum]KAH5670712.1 hypothetical protein HBI21_181570 [Parastagonospora nodorum]
MRTTTLLGCLPALSLAKLIEYPSEFQFNDLLKEHERVFVSFTSTALDSIAPLNDMFTKAAEDVSTPFISMDCHIGISLCQKYDVNSFPTFRLLERKKDDEKMEETRYRGPRTVKALMSFVRKHELPVLSKLGPEDKDFRRIDDVVFVAFLDPSDTENLETYQAVAQKNHLDFVFGYSTDSAIAEKESVKVPSIMCYRNNDNDNLSLNGPFTQENIEAFLLAARKSVIKDFSEKELATFMQRDKLTVYIFTHTTDTVSIRRELTPTAKKLQSHVTFAVVDLAQYPDMPANFGTEMVGEQALVVHAPMNDQIFKYAQGKKIEGAAIEDMLMTILRGKASTGHTFGDAAEDVDEEVDDEDGHDEL